MSVSDEVLSKSVSAFLESCGRDYEFPAGGQQELLTSQEAGLLETLRHCELSIEQQISQLASNRNWSDCYSIVVFGVRLAILAVRTNDAAVYRTGITALVAGCPKVDWRDVLGAFSIFEECGKRLSLEFQKEVESIAPYGGVEKLRSTLDGFFSRDEEMRAVDVMGFKEIGEGDNLTYRAKSIF